MNKIKELNGELKINSIFGQGTTIQIQLCESKPPPWFVSKINLKPNGQIIIIDDDESIHQVWNERLNSIYKKTDLNINRIHFSSPKEFKNYFYIWVGWCKF